MKYRLLEILQCPKCGGAFELDVFEADKRPQSSSPDTTMACRIRCGFLDRPVQALQAGQCAACGRLDGFWEFGLKEWRSPRARS